MTQNTSGASTEAKPTEIPPERQRSWPATNEDNSFFWDGAKEGELRIQECQSCGVLVHPPRPHCASCGSFDLGYKVASGRGKVYSHVTFHHPIIPPFEGPYSVAVVELAEGTRLISQVIGVDHSQVHIDLPVEVDFVEVEPGLTLPLFRPTAQQEI